MSQSQSRVEIPAFGFWKFVVVTTFLIVAARGGPNYLAKIMSTVPLSMFLWILYRVARTQPWWPANSNVALRSRFEAMGQRLKEHQQRENELNAESLRQMANKSLASRRAKSKNKYVVSAASNRSIEMSGADNLLAPRLVEPAPFKKLNTVKSNVGVRSKAVRAKTIRKRAVRVKRRPEFS